MQKTNKPSSMQNVGDKKLNKVGNFGQTYDCNVPVNAALHYIIRQ